MLVCINAAVSSSGQWSTCEGSGQVEWQTAGHESPTTSCRAGTVSASIVRSLLFSLSLSLSLSLFMSLSLSLSLTHTHTHTQHTHCHFSSQSKMLTQQITECHTSCHAQRLRQSFSDALTSVRQALVTARHPSSSSSLTQRTASLSDHCTSLYASIKSGLESSLGQLKVPLYTHFSLPLLHHNVCHYCYYIMYIQSRVYFSILLPGGPIGSVGN